MWRVLADKYLQQNTVPSIGTNPNLFFQKCTVDKFVRTCKFMQIVTNGDIRIQLRPCIVQILHQFSGPLLSENTMY